MNFSNFKNCFSYLLSITILGFLYFWIDKSNLMILLNVDLLALLISIVIAIVIYISSGWQYYLIRKKFGVSLQIRDIFFLPIVMNLWSFLIPFQGSLIFTTLFFKQKYDMKISESFSISIYLYLSTLCFTGLLGLFFTIYHNMLFSWIGLLSFLFLLNPLLLIIANKTFQFVGRIHFGLVNKIKVFIVSVVNSTHELWQDITFTLIILSINIIRLILSTIWFYWISFSLGFNLSFIVVGLISLIMSISIIIKITPDNLGIAQLIAGGFMGLVGASPEQAIIITLFASATTMIIIFTIGIYGNFYYFKTINFFSLVNSK